MDWDHDEFAGVFNEVYPGLCRFLECLLSFTGQAQEIAQEAFLRLYRRGPEGIPPGEIRFWIYRVARNLAVNEIRRRNTRARLKDAIAGIFRPAPPDPEAVLESAETERLVLLLLGTLPEHQRAALLLREQEEMSYREIATVLDASESKIKIDIFRARKTLRLGRLELNKGTRKICND
jgi:RNA polymerase sigma-70 factor (ECF subfamily)